MFLIFYFPPLERCHAINLILIALCMCLVTAPEPAALQVNEKLAKQQSKVTMLNYSMESYPFAFETVRRDISVTTCRVESVEKVYKQFNI